MIFPHYKPENKSPLNQHLLLILKNKMPETFFHTPVASVQPAATKSGGSNDLAIARVNFYFKTSDRWKVFQEIGNETLTDFFGKFSRLENAFGIVKHIVEN